jgi:hypothetical protein
MTLPCFHHMLLFAIWIRSDAGGVLEVELPMLHRCWPFKWLGHRGKARSDASVFRSRAGERCGSISAAAALLRLPPALSNRGWPWDLVCGPAHLSDHPGSLKADQLLGSRVWEADDAGHGRAHTAPAHHRVSHSRGVSSRYATQLLDIPVAWANWVRVQAGCKINKRLRLARAA